jgi:hypothetical protein
MDVIYRLVLSGPFAEQAMTMFFPHFVSDAGS